MKRLQAILAGVIFTLGIIFILHAQGTTNPFQMDATSVAAMTDMEVLLHAVESLPATPADAVPQFGTFWSAQHNPESAEPWPPLPANLANLPAWDMGGGIYLLDDRNYAWGKLKKAKRSASLSGGMMTMDVDLNPADGDDDDTNSDYDYSPSFVGTPIDTNGLWLQIFGVSNGAVALALNNATDAVYEIESTVTLDNGSNNWNIEMELWPTDTNSMPFTVPQLDRTDTLFLRAMDWTGVTSDGNETPDWWLWKYFGTTGLSDTNLDSDGDTLLYDYQNTIDPNVIEFSLQFTNDYVNTIDPTVQLDITGGVPSYYAVLVNDTNMADAIWQPYVSSNIVAMLGSADGAYTVYAGLRGLPADATATWRWTTVTLYSGAPLLTVTNPSGGTVSQSSIQLQGYASHPLDGLTFDVSNVAGTLTNQAGFLTGQFYDTNLLAYTTNGFECDIDLDAGTNFITLHATDWAGNTTNLSLTLDYSPSTNAPALKLVWPQDGMKVSGSNFTVQAQVDDARDGVTASINGNAVQGLVEQNGSAWVKDLPLNAGTNAVTLTATNIYGGVSVTNFNVVENDVGLVIDPLAADQMNQPRVTVTGSIGDPADDCVFVNGTNAYYLDDAGDWEADNVPVNPTGTATLNVQVYVGDPVLIASQTVNEPQPAMVVLAGYSYVDSTHFSSPSGWSADTINWAHDSGGTFNVSGYDPYPDIQGDNNYHVEDDLPADGTGYATPDIGLLTWDHFSVDTSYVDEGGDTVKFKRKSQAQVMLAPPGGQQAGVTNVYLVLASAMAFSDPVQYFGWADASDTPIAPDTLKVNGQPLINTGITNADGSVSGAIWVTNLSGKTLPLKTTAPASAFTFNNQILNFRLIAVSNSAVQINGTTNWAAVKTPTNDYVIVQLMAGNASIAGLTNAIQWSGGEAVTNNPLQRRVSKTVSTNTVVTASLGSISTSINVWVIWSTVTILTSGTNPTNAPQFGGVEDGTETLGVSYFNSSNSIAGKICAVATITPAGIHLVITNRWDFFQKKGTVTFVDGAIYPPWSFTPWTDDGPANAFKTQIPDGNEKLYTIDGPSMSAGSFGATNSVEMYKNFYDYITWNNQICCDTNVFWHFEGKWNVNQTPQFNSTEVNNGTINLP